MNGKMSMQAEREVPLRMQRKPVATLNEYTGKPVMKSALRAYESAAIAAHEIPPGGGTKAARCAAYSAFTNVKTEFANCRFADDRLIVRMHHLLRRPANLNRPVFAGFSTMGVDTFNVEA